MASKVKDKRIFIAVDISEEARRACVAHVDLLRKRFPYVRVGWERPEKLHITMKFLGSADGKTLERLGDVLSRVASLHPAFDVSLAAAGVFPTRGKPRVLWIGVDDKTHSLGRLSDAIEGACNSIGYESDLRRFRPHLTIGRVREPQSAAPLAKLHLKTKIEPVEFEVADVVIYESKLQPTGSVYSVIARFRFSV